MNSFSRHIHPHVQAELDLAAACEARGDFAAGFKHLERAHVLGQASTREHVRVHWQMLRWAITRRVPREALGQLLRIVGAAAMTGLGWVPHGNTGGSNVSPFRRMAIPPDLARLIDETKRRR